MWRIVKEYGGIALLLALAAFGISYYTSHRESALEASLGFIGDKLLALVPDGENKQNLAALYNDFKQQVLDRKIAPQQVEQVAASVLNLTQSEAQLTPEQAESVLRFSFLIPSAAFAMPVDTSSLPGFAPTAQVMPAAVPSVPLTSLDSLGERLKSACEFEKKYRVLVATRPEAQPPPRPFMRFRADDGLRLDIDVNLEAHLPPAEREQLKRELRQLEKERRVVWKENFSEEVQREMAHVRHEMHRLQEQTPQLKSQHVLRALEQLKDVPYLPPPALDSLHVVIERSVRQAEAAARAAERIPPPQAPSRQ